MSLNNHCGYKTVVFVTRTIVKLPFVYYCVVSVAHSTTEVKGL